MAQAVTVVGSYAVADYNSGVQVIDISNPTAPALVGAAETPGRAYGVVVAESYVFVADGTSGLQVLPTQCDVATAVEDATLAGLPQGLFQSAWPVPLRGSALRIAFAARGGPAGPALVTLHDVRGRILRTLARGHYTTGLHEVFWDGREADGRRLASGVYFLRVEMAGQTQHFKVPVIR